MLWAFRGVGSIQVLMLLRELHATILLVPLPFALDQLTETAAWRATFKELGCAVSYVSLLRIRLACEGIVQTLPGGILVAESLKPKLLMTQCGLTASDAVCGAASRKLLLLVSQCFYFTAAVVAGLHGLRTLREGWWLQSLIAAAWLALVLSASALTLVLCRGDVCCRLLRALKSLPLKAMRAATVAWGSGFTKTDARIVEFCALGPRRLARSTALYLSAWCWEAAETVLLLRLLGVRLDWGTLCLLEVCASMIRNVAFISPGGLGIQDLGYAGLLHIFGVPDWLSVAATFTLLKRSKELLWSAAGYCILATMRGKQPSEHAMGPTHDNQSMCPAG